MKKILIISTLLTIFNHICSTSDKESSHESNATRRLTRSCEKSVSIGLTKEERTQARKFLRDVPLPPKQTPSFRRSPYHLRSNNP